jgi:hypothetical protein
MDHKSNERGFSWKERRDSRGGRALSRNRICAACERMKTPEARLEDQQKQGNLTMEYGHRIGPPSAVAGNRGRIPVDDFHKSASEGEGACSKTSAGRSHLPLRGKLGWMTPRPGQKKAGKRNASFGGSCSQARAPIFFILSWGARFTRIVHRISRARTHLNLRYRSHRFHPPQHRNFCLPEYVLDFGLF